MNKIPGKFSSSFSFLLDGSKYYKSFRNKNVAYCSFKRLKCKAKIIKLDNGEWLQSEIHENHNHLDESRDFENEEKAKEEILKFCENDYNCSHSEIFKEVCNRYFNTYKKLTTLLFYKNKIFALLVI